MELVYLCTVQTASSVAVRKHTQEATAKTVKVLVSRTIFSKIFRARAFRIWFLLSHHSSSFYFTLSCFNKHKFFAIIINFLCSSISVVNDCSCSSGPEGKQRCKIGQLIFHLQVKVAWNSFPRHLYRISIKKKTLKKRLSLCEAKGNSLVFTKWLKSEVMAFQGNHNWCIYTWGNPVTWFFRSIS